jgi:predicted enzyme related to lactoylglutathione lyase
MDTMFEFYRDKLGLPPLGRNGDVWAGFRVGDQDIWLTPGLPEFPQRPGSDGGLVFKVSDIQATVEQLEQRGISPAGKGMLFPTGARQIPYRDPEGNYFAVLQPAQANGQGKA